MRRDLHEHVTAGRLLAWMGDNIGLTDGFDSLVSLYDPSTPRDVFHVSLADAMAVIDHVDAHSRHRILSGLRSAAQRAELGANDLAVWERYSVEVCHV